MKALAAFFDQLERAGSGRKLRVHASRHLARAYGVVGPGDGDEGSREASEVIRFLVRRGAKIPTSGRGTLKLEEEWAVASSDGEGEGE